MCVYSYHQSVVSRIDNNSNSSSYVRDTISLSLSLYLTPLNNNRFLSFGGDFLHVGLETMYVAM
jgi:hypothetical protein